MIVKDFSVEKTIDSGQFFRYSKEENWWYVHHNNQFFRIKQEDTNKITFEGTPKHFVTNFFNLNENMKKINKAINKDDTINKAIQENKGLRILQQDPWECMIGFVCSSASNIPKIKMNMHLLSQQFGEQEEKFGKTIFHFPPIRSLTDYQKIWNAKTGFRAKYVHAVNNLVDYSFFNKLKALSYDDCIFELQELQGIGPKVADCIALFSFGKTQAFPVDTWMRKIMTQHYFNGKKVSEKKIQTFAQDYFGRYAGYAQQYLFEASRRGFL